MGLSIPISAVDKRACRLTGFRCAIGCEVRRPDVTTTLEVVTDSDEGQNGEIHHRKCSHRIVVATAPNGHTTVKRRMIAGNTKSQSPPNMLTAGMS